MEPFDYGRASDAAGAVASLSRESTKVIAGGTNLVDLMRVGVERPAHLIDINELALTTIESTDGGVRIGAGGGLTLSGGLWLGDGSLQTLMVDGSATLTASEAALADADALLTLPRPARIAAVRDF